MHSLAQLARGLRRESSLEPFPGYGDIVLESRLRCHGYGSPEAGPAPPPPLPAPRPGPGGTGFKQSSRRAEMVEKFRTPLPRRPLRPRGRKKPPPPHTQKSLARQA